MLGAEERAAHSASILCVEMLLAWVTHLFGYNFMHLPASSPWLPMGTRLVLKYKGVFKSKIFDVAPGNCRNIYRQYSLVVYRLVSYRADFGMYCAGVLSPQIQQL